MLDIHHSRRDFLRVGAASSIGLSLADWFRLQAAGLATEGKAKSVIQLWMAGGPTQTDTFDPSRKPVTTSADP